MKLGSDKNQTLPRHSSKLRTQLWGRRDTRKANKWGTRLRSDVTVRRVGIRWLAQLEPVTTQLQHQGLAASGRTTFVSSQNKLRSKTWNKAIKRQDERRCFTRKCCNILVRNENDENMKKFGQERAKNIGGPFNDSFLQSHEYHPSSPLLCPVLNLPQQCLPFAPLWC